MNTKPPSNRNALFYCGFCRICGTGPLGLRQCGHCDRIALMCDECEALWPNLDLKATPQMGEEPSCPDCQKSFTTPPSHWANAAQIAATPWIQQAFRAGDIQLQYGEVPVEAPGDDPVQ